MLRIKKIYVIDEDRQPIAVQLDSATYRKIEELLEDYGLLRNIKEVDGEPPVTLQDARKNFSKTRCANHNDQLKVLP